MTPPSQPAGPALSQLRLRLSGGSLTLKLTVAFLVVGLLGALLVAFFVGQRTQRAFDQFVTDRGRPSLPVDLARYYETNRSWAGVERLLAGVQQDQPGGLHGLEQVLTTAERQVIVGSERYPAGTQVPPDARARSQPIIVGTTVVGWLIEDGVGRPRGPGSPEGDFLQRVARAISYSALGAAMIALLLGIVLARTLTRPLRELTAATQVVAQGALGQLVTVRSRDELGALALAFNQMSTNLARAQTLRRQMTADIAHDLRTPLSVILGYTEALRDGKLPPEQEIFDTLHTEAQHLQRLIDDLRTLSLTDAGELPLTREMVAVESLLERAAAAHRARAQEQRVALTVDVAAGLPQVEVDVERMAQVLGNLLSNALRYTPPGGTIVLDAQQHAVAVVQLRVRDSGSGIAPDDLPHVFERFYRADASRHGSTGSSGLGLAIARGIVEAHGGSITVESALGHGTTFTISLPVIAALRRGRAA